MIGMALFLLAIIALAGCSQSSPNLPRKETGLSKEQNKKLQVVTTFAPLYSFTLNIAGDAAQVKNLVPIGTSIHTFQAKPSDVKKIAQADVLITNGVGLETFLNDIIEAAAKPSLIIVDTSKSVKIIEQEELADVGSKKNGYKSGDPHIWLSPKNAIKQVETICNALAKADPGNAKVYKENTRRYIKRLETLHKDIASELAGAKKKKFIVFHNAYQYFEREYGLRSTASIEEFPGKEPGPRYLKNLIDLIQREGIKVIFTEPQFSPKIVKALTQETGVCASSLDPIGNELSSKGYEKMMRNNVKSIKEAFSRVADK